MKAASFFVSHKKYSDNSSLPWSVLILRDVLLHGGEYVRTSVNIIILLYYYYIILYYYYITLYYIIILHCSSFNCN